MIWEYDFFECLPRELQKGLDNRGERGWELVTATLAYNKENIRWSGTGEIWYCIMKKRVEV